MTVAELYAYLNEKIPPSLSCTWDNDGLMCASEPEREVKRVLLVLDITGAVVEQAIAEGYDAIISHHPMIFTPLRALDPRDPVAEKAMRLIRSGVAAMSFHTRLDAVSGGVNDTLAEALGLCEIQPFGADGEAIGRIGNLKDGMSLSEFCALVKRTTGAPYVRASGADGQVRRVAVLGGSGSDDVFCARAAGADTYLTGELKHHLLTDAPDMGICLVEAGHYHTEAPVLSTLREWLLQADASLCVTVAVSDPVQVF